MVEASRENFPTARVVRAMDYIRYRFEIPRAHADSVTLAEAQVIERAMRHRKAVIRLHGSVAGGKIISWTQPCNLANDPIIIVRKERSDQSHDTFLQPLVHNVAIPLTGFEGLTFPSADIPFN